MVGHGAGIRTSALGRSGAVTGTDVLASIGTHPPYALALAAGIHADGLGSALSRSDASQMSRPLRRGLSPFSAGPGVVKAGFIRVVHPRTLAMHGPARRDLTMGANLKRRWLTAWLWRQWMDSRAVLWSWRRLHERTRLEWPT